MAARGARQGTAAELAAGSRTWVITGERVLGESRDVRVETRPVSLLGSHVVWEVTADELETPCKGQDRKERSARTRPLSIRYYGGMADPRVQSIRDWRSQTGEYYQCRGVEGGSG